ncbi:MAG TPA: hypothetical protein VFJ64_10820 [Solirubrobacterales bacterium]|nr:hypothetical protein [Solirubrobacterales bacterium]
MSFRIERVWVFVAVHPDDGDEGVIQVGDTWIPFAAGDERRLEQLKERVRAMPFPPGLTVKLVRFETRTDVEVVR